MPEAINIEALRQRMRRSPTPEEAEKIKRNLEVFENQFSKISIDDGLEFILNLRKEANRQKAFRACKNFELQTRDIKHVPYVPHEAAERQLADTFEIIEEFDVEDDD